jgi:hypothetical protein
LAKTEANIQFPIDAFLFWVEPRVSDPHPFHADPDLDPGFEIYADPDPDPWA